MQDAAAFAILKEKNVRFRMKRAGINRRGFVKNINGISLKQREETMKELYEAIAKRLRNGESVVLATVLKSSGSTPRGAGAQMLVFENGTTMGTVGGGTVEYETGKLGVTLLREKRSEVKRYQLTNDQVADLGMICGGRVTVALQYIPASDIRFETLFSDAANLCSKNEDAWLILLITDNGTTFETAISDGNDVSCTRAFTIADVRPFLWNKAVYEAGETAWFCMPIAVAGRTYVFGGGHVAQKLVPLLSFLHYSVTVIDDRPEFCNAEVFPDAESCRVIDSFDDALSGFDIGVGDEIVIMTRGHQSDYEVVEQALKTSAAYIGCIGSHHKVALTRKRLLAAGYSEQELSRLHAPIGLPIRAETPEEIAVSVAAEMIRCRAERH